MWQVMAIGRLRDEPEAALFARYAGRTRPKLGLVELTEARGAPAEVKRREGAALLGALPANAFVVVLDLGGEAVDSVRFASKVERWLGMGRPVCFLIGGAEGLDAPGTGASGCDAGAGGDDLAALFGPRDAGGTIVSGPVHCDGASVPP